MKNSHIQRAIIMLAAIIFSHQAIAANVNVNVLDFRQVPLDFAVIYINETLPPLEGEPLAVDQVDKEFIPFVTAIQRGGAINFLNNDNIRHQVYSFSDTKQFEIPLFKNNPLRPVSFDNAGAVPIACNIHDWMEAYIYVVDTDKFVLTDTFGNGSISNLPNGEYEVVVWHPNMGSDAPTTQKVNLNGSDQQLTFTVTQKPEPKGGGRRIPKNRNRRNY